MRRLLTYSLLLLTLFGGVAAADRDDRRDRREDRRDRREDRRDRREDRREDRRDRRDQYDRRGPVVRDHRDYRRYDRYDRGPVVRTRADRRVVTRNRVYVNNGRYVFHNGVSRAYHRPVIRQRYYDYRVRPQIVVEHYDPVPGYVWVQGRWQWNGYEWLWVSGHFEPDARYTVWYDDDTWE